MKLKKLFSPIFLIIIIWSLFHISFFWINEILKNADSFAYLQMSYHFQNLNLEWFWTWWFWFFYSFFIAIFKQILFFVNEYYSTLLLNIVLFWISAYILFKIWEKYLEKKFNLILIILFYLSPIFLSFNITILSENIYIPLFLWLILFLLNKWKDIFKIWNIFIVAIFISFLYFTRAEAFIYIWSIFLIILYFSICKGIDKNRGFKIFKTFAFFLAFFLILVSPYLLYMNSFTWEWWLTNKWSSNLRQAELRWTEKMDDEWFEKAVWELTADNHNLKSWFVWWLKYNNYEKTQSLRAFMLANPETTITRFLGNQYKLYLKNIPELIIWNSIKLFYSKDSFLYWNYIFLIICLIPFFLVIFWIYKMFILNKNDLIIIWAFFLVASVFFTLFFVLNRYFLVFLAFFLLFWVYWIQNLKLKYKDFLVLIFVSIYILWIYSFYNSEKLNDWKYEVKKIAWIWLKNNIKDKNLSSLKIMERFPIVTYYSNSKERWLTPYTDELEKLIEYAKFNQINYLVVDTLDFKTYRPKLNYLLDDNFNNKSLKKIWEFEKNNEKVILYKFNY